MKLTGQFDGYGVDVAAGGDSGTRRVWIRLGRWRLSLSPDEAVHLARGLVDAIEQARAGQTVPSEPVPAGSRPLDDGGRR